MAGDRNGGSCHPPTGMRAQRLVSVVLLLQTRGGSTSEVLADELGISVPTVHRDVEALRGRARGTRVPSVDG